MSRQAHADLRAIAKSLRPGSSGRGRRSPLFRWLYDRSAAFKRVLEETRPSWEAVTDALAKEGLTNSDGKPLTRRRVQKTWYAVERAKARTTPEQKPHGTPAAIAAIQAPPLAQPLVETVQPSQTPVGSSRDAAMARMRAQFKPITIAKRQEQTP